MGLLVAHQVSSVWSRVRGHEVWFDYGPLVCAYRVTWELLVRMCIECPIWETMNKIYGSYQFQSTYTGHSSRRNFVVHGHMYPSH